MCACVCVSELPFNGWGTCPGCTPPLVQRLLEMDTSNLTWTRGCWYGRNHKRNLNTCPWDPRNKRSHRRMMTSHTEPWTLTSFRSTSKTHVAEFWESNWTPYKSSSVSFYLNIFRHLNVKTTGNVTKCKKEKSEKINLFFFFNKRYCKNMVSVKEQIRILPPCLFLRIPMMFALNLSSATLTSFIQPNFIFI